MYKYIDIGALITRNIDLKRKVKFKTRKVHRTQIKDRAVFENRTYDDFKALNLQLSEFWEMDTVLSGRGSLKCILTFVDPEISLFYARLLPCHEACYVERAFDILEKTLGGVYEFQSMLPVILTDRGSEFGKPDNLETNKDGIIRTSIYYCDPMRSGQKGCLEEAHTLLRMILPKGTVFTDVTQWDVRRIVNHINSYRKSIAITPCTAEHPMSFKVPDRLLTDGQCRMMINGIQFIQALLEANGLAAGKDHQFKGRYDAEKNAVIISLKNGE